MLQHTRRLIIDADNTNADPETRAYWVALAKKLNVPIRCIHFTAPVKLCEHNDTVRALNIGPNVGLSANVYHHMTIACGTRNRNLLHKLRLDCLRSVSQEPC
jgi:predicted kinase